MIIFILDSTVEVFLLVSLLTLDYLGVASELQSASVLTRLLGLMGFRAGFAVLEIAIRAGWRTQSLPHVRNCYLLNVAVFVRKVVYFIYQVSTSRRHYYGSVF